MYFTHTHGYIQTYTYINIHSFIYVHTHIHIYIYVCLYVCMYVYTYLSLSLIHKWHIHIHILLGILIWEPYTQVAKHKFLKLTCFKWYISGWNLHLFWLFVYNSNKLFWICNVIYALLEFYYQKHACSLENLTKYYIRSWRNLKYSSGIQCDWIIRKAGLCALICVKIKRTNIHSIHILCMCSFSHSEYVLSGDD